MLKDLELATALYESAFPDNFEERGTHPLQCLLVLLVLLLLS